MTERPTSAINVRLAGQDDIPSVKTIADLHRHELGFIPRGELLRAVHRDDLVVADFFGVVAGFCQRYRRKDGIVSIYHLAVHTDFYRKGIGESILHWIQQQGTTDLAQRIQLKCPEDIQANQFYAAIGFTLDGMVSNERRHLCIWSKEIVVSES